MPRGRPTLAGTVTTTPSEPPTNRRIAPRIALRTPATVRLPGGQTRDVQVWDLAVDGASLLSPRPIAQGSSAELHLVLPGRTDTLVAPVRVVYSSYQGPGQFRVGLSFQHLPPEAAEAIAAFCA